MCFFINLNLGNFMDFFINSAFAEGAQQNINSSDVMSQLVVFGIVFVVFWLLFIRPQSKRIKEHKEMTEDLSKNDEVVTNGGLLGKIVALKEDYVVVEISKGIQVTVQRQAISSLLPKGTIKENKA